MTLITLGTVYEPAPNEMGELRAAVRELTGEDPDKKELRGYAGPNEVVQVLLDPTHWERMLYLLASIFGVKFVGKLGDLAAAEVWKNKASYARAMSSAAAAPFRRFGAALNALRDRDQTIVIGVPSAHTTRNIGFVETSTDPVDLALHLALIVRCAPQIVRTVEALATIENPYVQGSNPDLSVAVTIGSDGTIWVAGQIVDCESHNMSGSKTTAAHGEQSKRDNS